MDKKELEELIRTFEREERRLLQGPPQSLEGFLAEATALLRLKGRIKEGMSDFREAPILQRDLRPTLRALKADSTKLDKRLRALLETLGIRGVSGFESDELALDGDWVQTSEFDDLLQRDILSRIDPTGYRIGKLRMGALVTGQKLPDETQEIFQRIKLCYIFGFEDAAVVFCRALVEATLKRLLQAALERKGQRAVELPARKAERVKIKDLMLQPLIELGKNERILDDEILAKIESVQQNGNRVAHGKKPKVDPLCLIREAMDIVETLYAEAKN